ncbi:MAG: multidrug effflux MFS transporter [Geminicoccaceae bacterium]
MPTARLGTPEFVVLFSLVTSMIAISIDAVLPAMDIIGRDLNVAHPNDVQLVISMFILGMVAGELVFGPLSDAIGRKRAILIGIFIYVVGTLIAMSAGTLFELLAGRVVQGIGVSGPKIGSRALIRDQFEGDAMARITSLIFMIFILVPMIAPALGQLILIFASWRWIFLLFLGLALIVSLWLGLRQPETLAPERRIPIALPHLMVNTILIVRHPKVMACTLAAGLIFGAIIVYVSTSQALFADLYDKQESFPLYFAILASAIGLSSFWNSQLVMRFGMSAMATVALCGLILTSTALLMVTFAYQGVPPFALFMGLCFVAFGCFGLLFGNLNAMAMEALGRVAGLGASLIAAFSSLIAVILSVSVGRFYDQTLFPMTFGFLLAGVGSLILILAVRRNRSGAV